VTLGRVGTELFGWLILVTACAMVVDWMLANRFYAPLEDPSRKQAHGSAAQTESGPAVEPLAPTLESMDEVREEVPT